MKFFYILILLFYFYKTVKNKEDKFNDDILDKLELVLNDNKSQDEKINMNINKNDIPDSIKNLLSIGDKVNQNNFNKILTEAKKLDKTIKSESKPINTFPIMTNNNLNYNFRFLNNGLYFKNKNLDTLQSIDPYEFTLKLLKYSCLGLVR